VSQGGARRSLAARLRALDAAQQRHPGLALPLAVVKKLSDEGGGQFAGLIAYYAFCSLFPLLLVVVSILGLLVHGDTTLQQQILKSSLASFPVIGDQIRAKVTSLSVGGVPLVIGIVLALLAGLGVTRATQTAQDRLWGVLPEERHSWLRTRGRGLALLAVIGGANIATTVLDGLIVAGSPKGALATLGALVASIALDFGLFVAVFVLMTSYPARVREILPGAIFATVAWELLQHAGGYLVVHELRHLSDTYGLFALVLGTLAWLHLGAQAMLYAVALNVVRARRLWPRSMFGPPPEAQQR
jgi:YihY family inner membrane protein